MFPSNSISPVIQHWHNCQHSCSGVLTGYQIPPELFQQGLRPIYGCSNQKIIDLQPKRSIQQVGKQIPVACLHRTPEVHTIQDQGAFESALPAIEDALARCRSCVFYTLKTT